MGLLILGATIIDAVSDQPVEGRSIWIECGRIKAIALRDELPVPPGIRVIDARGKYVIPGLMNANVHLLCDARLEILARYTDRWEDLIAEAAQVALKNGLTTVFDTWGPRRYLMAVRDRIKSGEIPGSRIFCAGNIIGFDGPFSEDFLAKVPDVASGVLTRRVNAIWVENTGRHLMWLPPDRVAKEVRAYIDRGIDFIKYGSNEHGKHVGAFLVFSAHAQAAMVDEARRAGITAQAHTMTVEGLRVAVEAGCDLIQHANITGPVPIPETTLELMKQRNTAAVIFPWTELGLEWIMKNVTERERTMWYASDANARNFIRSGAPILLANDGSIFAPEAQVEPGFMKSWAGVPAEEALVPLGSGHFTWFKAMEEKGCSPMVMLRAATRNIARAYGKEKDLGTIEVGKIADLLVLDKNPLQGAENYRSIHVIVKDGELVDREALPVNRLLTRPLDPPVEEEARYVPWLVGAGIQPSFPMCACCR